MPKILLVDDDQDLTSTVEGFLVFDKHEVTTVHTGFDCWRELQSGKYDLIILDWDLPDVNGIDITKRFRSSGGATPIILLTGHTSVEDKESGLDSGANDYLTKPFHMKELGARIRATLRNCASVVKAALPNSNEDVLQKGQLHGTSLAAHYEFIDIVGEGGAGLVFKARHAELGRLVAIKMLSELRESSINRFKREAQSISLLEHPNIIMIYDFGVTEKSQPYMVMEFVDGPDLGELLANNKRLSLEEALDTAFQVATGMAAAHKEGILHRDIKPSNIMFKKAVDGKSVVKILDFGLAKLKHREARKNADQLTKDQEVFGTAAYMSPEQIRGRVVDERADIYSFGCVLYEMLTGKPPFVGESSMDTLMLHLQQQAPSLASQCPDQRFPQQLQEVIYKTLSKSADDRYASMDELAIALQSCRG